jgi:hypothetical protein
MNYSIQPTSNEDQALLISKETHGDKGICPVLSLQMPKHRAQQIVCAFKIVQMLIDTPIQYGENKTQAFVDIQRLAMMVKDMKEKA